MRSASPRALLSAASAAVALAAADTYVVVLALTDMMAGVGIGIDALQRATPIISGFLLGYIAVLPLIGRLSDLLDRRRILLGCLLVFAVGSAVTALAVEMPVLVTGRVLQGIGGGGLVPATLALVADLWPPHRRGTPLGVVGAVQELGSCSDRCWARSSSLVGMASDLLAQRRCRSRVVCRHPPPRVPLGLVGAGRGGGRRGAPEPAVRCVAAVLTALGLGVTGLALAAPESLVTDVTLGAPFVPFAGTSRLLTPIGVVGLGLLLVVAVADGTALVGRAAARRPRRGAARRGRPRQPRADLRVVRPGEGGRRSARLQPAARRRRSPSSSWPGGTARGRRPLIPRGVVGARGSARSSSACSSARPSSRSSSTSPCWPGSPTPTTRPAAALVLVRFLLAVPVGALLGGWSLRRLGDGAVAGAGLVLAGGRPARHVPLDVESVGATVPATVVLVVVGLGMGLALAPVNNAALADSPADAHGVASSLVVVARMVGMVVGLALLTSIGLRRYFEAVRALPDQLDTGPSSGPGSCRCRRSSSGAPSRPLLAARVACGWGSDLSETRAQAPVAADLDAPRGVRRRGDALRSAPRRPSTLGATMISGSRQRGKHDGGECSGRSACRYATHAGRPRPGRPWWAVEPGLMLSSSGVSTRRGADGRTLSRRRRPPGEHAREGDHGVLGDGVGAEQRHGISPASEAVITTCVRVPGRAESGRRPRRRGSRRAGRRPIALSQWAGVSSSIRRRHRSRVVVEEVDPAVLLGHVPGTRANACRSRYVEQHVRGVPGVEVGDDHRSPAMTWAVASAAPIRWRLPEIEDDPAMSGSLVRYSVVDPAGARRPRAGGDHRRGAVGQASTRSTITGAWSLAPLPLRSSRSMARAGRRGRRGRGSRGRSRSACPGASGSAAACSPSRCRCPGRACAGGRRR